MFVYKWLDREKCVIGLAKGKISYQEGRESEGIILMSDFYNEWKCVCLIIKLSGDLDDVNGTTACVEST